MKLSKCLLFVSLFCCFNPPILANHNTSSPILKFDPQIQHGTLNNGLRYFILPNPEPQNRVYIRLIVNAGSMNEDDDQKGVAHLVEHMAFNGSQKYPQNQIIQVLEQLGMKFAHDINAFTDFEHTIYTLNLNQNDPQKLALAFDVLDQWINHLTILPQDLDNERGIVVEEWRRRLSPMLRLGDQKSAIEMAGSRYVLRDPIGDMQIIRHISPQRVMDFYRTWYRPDNMAIVVVGDVQAPHIAHLIQQKLGSPSKISTAYPTIDYHIPLIEQFRVASVSEAEINTPAIEFNFLEQYHPQNSESAYKQELIMHILTRLLNLRLQQWEKQSQHTAIASANFYRTAIGRENIQSTFSIQLHQADYDTTIQQLFAFIAQLEQYGFQQQEFNHEIARLKKLNLADSDIRAGSLSLADQLMNAVATQQVMISPQQKFTLNQKFLNDIHLEDIQHAFQKIIDLKAKLLLITQPYPAQTLPFKPQDMAQLWQQTRQQPQTKWHDQQHGTPQIPAFNQPMGSIKKIKHWQKGNIDEYQLSNGLKLIYHYSDKTPNQVQFKAITKGGLRSIPKQDYDRLRTALTLVDNNGIGQLSSNDVQQLFAQKSIVLSSIIDDDQQGFAGVAKTQDLADLLHLFYLKLQSAPISEQTLQNYHLELADEIKHQDIEHQFMQHVEQLRYPNIPTIYQQNPQQLLDITASQFSDIYQHYMLDKTDFTYFIIGDISPQKVQTLAKKYLASIPVKQQQRSSYTVQIATPKQPFIMHGLSEPRAEVEIYFATQHQWQAQEQYLIDILGDVLQEKLRLALREQVSGVYSVNSWFNQTPYMPQLEGKIEFSCDPQRVPELLHITHQILDDIQKNGVEPQLLAKKFAEKQQLIQQEFQSLITVSDLISHSFMYNRNPDLVYLYQHLDYATQAQHINTLAKQILQRSARFEAILQP